MAYTALPDRRIPYDNDGTIVIQGTPLLGPYSYPSGTAMQEWQDEDITLQAGLQLSSGTSGAFWLFFPEQREFTGIYFIASRSWPIGSTSNINPNLTIYGSNDSGNGIDGTWETASTPSGIPTWTNNFDGWRSGIKPVSFTGPKRVTRLEYGVGGAGGSAHYVMVAHFYGEKAAGQTPDDIIYINHDDTPGVEYAAAEDFGDQALGTTVVRQFRLKNVSGSKTANTINVQCNDADFAISEDGVVWVVTINITSLSAGAESATLYVRCTTPAPGGQLGPRFGRIVTTVGSYT